MARRVTAGDALPSATDATAHPTSAGPTGTTDPTVTTGPTGAGSATEVPGQGQATTPGQAPVTTVSQAPTATRSTPAPAPPGNACGTLRQAVFQVGVANLRAVALVTQPETSSQIVQEVRAQLSDAAAVFRSAEGQTGDTQLKSAARTYANAVDAAAAAVAAAGTDADAVFDALAISDPILQRSY